MGVSNHWRTESEDNEGKQMISSIKSQERRVKFKIHIAIDFGTDGCAIAYYYHDQVIVYNKWMTKTRQRTATKTKTQILLNDKDEVVAFGDNAKIIYSSLTGKEKKTWKFFDSLYNDYGSRYLKSVNNEQECKSRILFINAFKQLGQIACDYMHQLIDDHDIKINKEQIQWIVTIPTIWNGTAKYKMKDWIIKAGLVGKHIKDQCLIRYESDCAALAIFEEIKQQKSLQYVKQNGDHDNDDDEKNTESMDLFKIGNKYIVINAGDRSIDIAYHRIMSENAVETVHYRTGSNWCSSYIDDSYIKLLKDIFGKQLIIIFKQTVQNVYLEIIDYFQTAKMKFYKKKNASTHSVHLPYEFVQYLQKRLSNNGVSMEAKLKEYNNSGNKESVTWNAKDESLIIDTKIWKIMFNTYIDKIIEDVQILLNDKQKFKDCKCLALVGSFSCSKYFQFKIKDEFGKKSHYKLNIKIPKNPTLSVVIGAAKFGSYYAKNKHFIQNRNENIIQQEAKEKELNERVCMIVSGGIIQ